MARSHLATCSTVEELREAAKRELRRAYLEIAVANQAEVLGAPEVADAARNAATSGEPMSVTLTADSMAMAEWERLEARYLSRRDAVDRWFAEEGDSLDRRESAFTVLGPPADPTRKTMEYEDGTLIAVAMFDKTTII